MKGELRCLSESAREERRGIRDRGFYRFRVKGPVNQAPIPRYFDDITPPDETPEEAAARINRRGPSLNDFPELAASLKRSSFLNFNMLGGGIESAEIPLAGNHKAPLGLRINCVFEAKHLSPFLSLTCTYT